MNAVGESRRGCTEREPGVERARPMLWRPLVALAALELATALGGAIGAPSAYPLTPVLAAQQIPQLPPGTTPQQAQQYLQQPGIGDQIRQQIQNSGLTPDQVRARLRAAGYPDNLIDQYLQQGTPGQAAPAPTAEMLQAVSALGLGNFLATPDSLRARRDSLILSRDDSLFADSLGFQIGVDSIPTRRDSLGILRVDSLAAVKLSARLHRPHVFGLDIFRRTSTLFNPMASGPVDPDYRLGPGDELVLILTGDVELGHQLPVTREGFIVIPQVGQIYVANLTLDQLRSLLYTRLGRVYSGVRRGAGATTQFQISVAKVRTNQVFVMGEVARPGAYAVSALGTVMNALYAAGGPTERGDFRAVRVMRAGQLVGTLDLYDYLLAGNTRSDVRLEQGDVVLVPPAQRRVTIQGAVVRPAIYDLAQGQDLRELIGIAGGLLPQAYTGRAQIQRVLPADQRQPGGRDRTVVDVDLQAVMRPAAPTFRLEPADSIVIFAVATPVRNRVAIKGAVWRPGTYELDSAETLSALIADAGGLKPDVYLGRAQILRLNADSTRRLIPVSLAGIPPQGAPGSGDSDLPAGSAATPAGHLALDPALQEYDEITVYSKTFFRPNRLIAVYGAVQRPGLYAFSDSMTLLDAVMMAGGLRDEAYLLEAEISRIPDERQPGELAQVMRVALDSAYVLDATGYLRRPTGPGGSDPMLAPYDNVFIRRVPGWALQRNVVLAGEVRFPGRYTLLRRDERLLDVIKRAGGLTPDAYVGGAQFFRKESAGRGGTDLEQLEQDSSHRDIRTWEGSARVGIDLERVLRDPGFRDNFVLYAGDSLFVPQYQSIVRVEGGVNSPVSVAYVPGRGTGYYVDRAGGFSRSADKGRTYVVQPNGSVERRSSTPQPGARVVVPEIPPGEVRGNWAQTVSVLGSLLTGLAGALTAILVARRL